MILTNNHCNSTVLMKMASCTTAAAGLPNPSFHPRTTYPRRPTSFDSNSTKTRLPISFCKSPKTLQMPFFITPNLAHLTLLCSVDVSKEDKPTQSPENPDEEQQEEGEGEKFDKRRLEEKFAVVNTGISECRSCGYKYDKATGDPSYPIPPGMEFEKLPEDWRCPTCGAARSFFVSKSVEIAGFAENQQFGFGGNALTSGQKAILIYGSLLLFFVFFLSGYFLQ